MLKVVVWFISIVLHSYDVDTFLGGSGCVIILMCYHWLQSCSPSHLLNKYCVPHPGHRFEYILS